MEINGIEMSEFRGVTAPTAMWEALGADYGYSNNMGLSWPSSFSGREGARVKAIALIERAKDQLPNDATGEQIVRRAIVLQADDALPTAIEKLAVALRHSHVNHSHSHAHTHMVSREILDAVSPMRHRLALEG